MAILQPGPKFIAGHIEEGQFVLTRDDGTTHVVVPNIGNIYLTAGSLTDDGDETLTISIPEA